MKKIDYLIYSNQTMERSLTKIKDVDLNILSKVEDIDVLNFGLTSKYGKELCSNKHFWRNRLVEKYGLEVESFKNPNRNWQNYYLGIVYYSDKYPNVNVAMSYADKDLVDFFISKGATGWNFGMYGAAYGGHKDLADFFISKGAFDWNEGMFSAAEGGHEDLVEFFISKGANNWNEAMYHASLGDHRDLVDFFRAYGWNSVIYFAHKLLNKLI